MVGDVVEERVDREVAAERVFFRRAEGVVALDQQILARGRVDGGIRHFADVALSGGVGGGRIGIADRDVLPEGGDLDGLVAELDVREPEAPADDPAVPEELLDLIRVRRRADVEVFRPPTQQQVADASANEIGGVVRLVQARQHLHGIGVDRTDRDGMCSSRDDDGPGHDAAL